MNELRVLYLGSTLEALVQALGAMRASVGKYVR
jgi:hypothetical protein